MKLSDIYVQIILTILSFPIGWFLKYMSFLSPYQMILFCFAVALLIPLRLEKARQNEGRLKKAKMYFPGFNFGSLETYANRWVKKYKALKVKKIILYRYNTENQEKGMVKFNNIVVARKYAIVFIYSRHIKLDSSLLEFYPMEDDNEIVSDAKKLIHAEQYASQGHHHLFDQTFPKDIYIHTPIKDYFKEWTILLFKSGSEIKNPNIYKDESVVLWERGLLSNFFMLFYALNPPPNKSLDSERAKPG